ncbi:nicotinamide riboside kinase 1 isoform X1 [Arctopsyche grandis]|uniref:nicotinamide riboside kinase 1 isoform X1 n=1 Tax=Arctopsyche grandis TaxID=121162 RepID=UPI00406D74CC
MSNMWIVVGLSGVTCGGKSTISKKLKDTLKRCEVLNQDDYFHPDDSPILDKVENLEHNNYDNLACLDMEKMYDDVMKIINKSDPSDEPSVLVLDGFLILNYKPIADLCRLKYQVFLDREECLRRRHLRTYLPPDIPGYFELCVWPEYCKYNDEVKMMDDVTFLDGKANDSFDKILNDIKQLF